MQLLLALVLFLVSLSGVAQAQTYPPDQSWPGSTTAQPLAMPGYRQSVTDPYTGAKITRVSGTEMAPSQIGYLQTIYSKVGPFNKDGTLVMLAGSVYILNTSDWSVFKQWNYHNDARWSTVEADVLFYTTGNQFRKVNVRTNVDTLIYNFCTSTPFNCTNIAMGADEGNLSIGDGKVVFKAGSTAILYNIATNTVLATSSSIGANMSDWISVSQSGNYVIACSNTGAGIHVYDMSLAFVRTLYTTCQHTDMGYDFAGNEVAFEQCPNKFARLDTAASTSVTPSGCNGQISTRSYNRPGWAYMNQFGYVYAKKMDSSTTVEIWAHHRSTESTYAAQAKASVSPDGRKMIWNSDWGVSGGTVYTFVAEMPAATDTTAPTVPSGVNVTNSGSSATVAWSASSDFVGVNGYTIRRCTGAACTPTATLTTVGGSTLSYVNTGLAAGTTYGFSVNAFDLAGNQSAFSSTVYVTTGSTYPTVSALDSFGRADGTLGADWDDGYTSQAAFALVSNQLRVSAANTNSLETYNAVVTPNDQWCQITILTVNGTGARAPGCLLRFSNSPTVTGYDVRAQLDGSNNGIRIQEHTAGALATLASGTTLVTWQAGDKLRGEVEGTTLRAYQIRGSAKTLIATATDASNASGKTGMAMYVATGVATDAVQIDDFAMGGFSGTAPTAPAITSVDASTTSATVVSANSPTHIRVATATVSVVEPIASFPANVYTYPASILASLTTSICFYARDVIGIENPSGVCDTTITSADTTAPAMSSGSPSGILPSGTTSATISLATDEPATCKYDTTDTAYASMTYNMTDLSLSHSATVTGLTDGSLTPYYVRCTDSLDNTNTASLIITVQVAAATDSTPPILSSGSPSGALAQGTTSVLMQLVTNENATCKYGTVAGTAYGSIANTFSTTGTTTHSQTISVSDGNTYTYYVRCTDSIPNANTTDFTITWSVTALPPDVSPPILTAGAPSGTLAAGTTSTNMTLTTSEAATCKYGTIAGVAYASLPSTFGTTGGTSHSQSITGMTDNTNWSYYVKCQDAAGNASGDYLITWYVTVAAGDTTAPTDPSNLVAVALSQTQAELVWTASTDAGGVSHYDIYGCQGSGCTNYSIVQQSVSATTFVVALAGSTSYTFVVKAVDLSGNQSGNSNTATVTTGGVIDYEAPSTMANLQAVPYSASVKLTWDVGSDNSGIVFSIIEQCAGAGCSDFTVVKTDIAGTQIIRSLSPSTVYCFRGKHSDVSGNVSAAYSATVCTTTTAGGLRLLNQPRKSSITRSTATARTAR